MYGMCLHSKTCVFYVSYNLNIFKEHTNSLQNFIKSGNIIYLSEIFCVKVNGIDIETLS